MAVVIGELLGSPESSSALAECSFARGKRFQWRDNAVAVRQTLLKAMG